MAFRSPHSAFASQAPHRQRRVKNSSPYRAALFQRVHPVLIQTEAFLQHLAGVLAQARRPAAILRRRAVQAHGVGHQRGRVRPGHGQLERQFTRMRLGVIEHLPDRLDRSAGHPGRVQGVGPGRAVALGHHHGDLGDQNFAIGHPVSVAPEARILRPVRTAQRLGEGGELAVIAHGHRDASVLRGKVLIGHDVGMGVGAAPR